MAEELIPIVQRSYDFAGALYGYVNRFPRAHKPLIGRELMGLALRLLVALVTANRRREKAPRSWKRPVAHWTRSASPSG